MPIQAQCPSCKNIANLPETAIGKTVRCCCGQTFQLSQPPAANLDDIALQPPVQPAPTVNPIAKRLREERARDEAQKQKIKQAALAILLAPVALIVAAWEKLKAKRHDVQEAPSVPQPLAMPNVPYSPFASNQPDDPSGRLIDKLFATLAFVAKTAVVLLILGAIGGGIYYYQKKADEEKARQSRIAAEDKRRAEEQRLADEKRVSEEQRLAQERRVAEDEQKRKEEAEAAAKRQREVEEKRQREAEEQQRKVQEQQRLAEEQARIQRQQPQQCQACQGTGRVAKYKQIWPTRYPGPNTAQAKCIDLNDTLTSAAGANRSGSFGVVVTRQEQWQVLQDGDDYVIVRGYSVSYCNCEAGQAARKRDEAESEKEKAADNRCPRCKGRGKIMLQKVLGKAIEVKWTDHPSFMWNTKPCPDCNGTGLKK